MAKSGAQSGFYIPVNKGYQKRDERTDEQTKTKLNVFGRPGGG